MPSPRNPIPNTGPYTPPAFVRPESVPTTPIHGIEGPLHVSDAAKLVDILRLLYPIHADRPPDRFDVGRGFVNNLPVADRQTLTMAAKASGDPNHPLLNTGPYRTRDAPYPVASGDDMYGPVPPGVAASAVPASGRDMIAALLRLYPNFSVGNSQAIGDRSPTTMTNPLPAYSPLTMVKGQAAAQLRTLINHALAQRGLAPLINAPLPVGPTQMGMAR